MMAKLLIVEDDPTILEGISKVLTQAGYTVVTATNGQEALERLQETSVDLILVSHLHGDHFGGIPFFMIDAQFGRRVRPLQVVGPPGIEARVKEAMEVFFPGSSQTQRKFETCRIV